MELVRALIDRASGHLPDTLDIRYIMDQSDEVRDILYDLLNNVLTAIVLVIIVVIAAMGPRSALLVGLTIPGAFLTGILVIWSMGVTLNIVVLFSLILVAGMLVDGAIVVSELADRNLNEGQPVRTAWWRPRHAGLAGDCLHRHHALGVCAPAVLARGGG